MVYCPWCRDDFEDELFCTGCGRPVALKAQPGVQVMLQTSVISERSIHTAQRRLISKVRQKHMNEIMKGMVQSSMEGDRDFAADERERMEDQGEDVKERFNRFSDEADEGCYAPDPYQEY